MTTTRELRRLIGPDGGRYSERFSKTLLDRKLFVGDALADDAVLLLRESGYDPDGGQLARLRALADQGEPPARAFFDAADDRPAWVDQSLLDHGRRFPLAMPELYGISLMHSLFAGGVFVRAALVTAATGRLGSDTSRRIRETTGFVAQVMEPDGLEPGSRGFETILRVRLLHGSIRYWTTKKKAFEAPYVGVPIDQTMLAMTLSLFSYLNVRSLLRLGVPLTDHDIGAHQHRWRYIGHLLGIDDDLLCEDIEAEHELWSALVAHQTFPELFGPPVFDRMVAAMSGAMAGGRIRRPADIMRAALLHLSGPEWFGLPPGDGPAIAPTAAMCAAGAAMGGVYRWITPLQDRMIDRGRGLLQSAVEAGRAHGYGVEIEDRSDDDRAATQVAAVAVHDRFAAVSGTTDAPRSVDLEQDAQKQRAERAQ